MEITHDIENKEKSKMKILKHIEKVLKTNTKYYIC